MQGAADLSAVRTMGMTEMDALFNEYRRRGIECTPNDIRDTSWGTREFALYDPDRNALTFYRNLTSAEKARRSV